MSICTYKLNSISNDLIRSIGLKNNIVYNNNNSIEKHLKNDCVFSAQRKRVWCLFYIFFLYFF